MYTRAYTVSNTRVTLPSLVPSGATMPRAECSRQARNPMLPPLGQLQLTLRREQ